MRKSFDGLCGLVISVMNRQPTSGEVFVFRNRSRTITTQWVFAGVLLGGLSALYLLVKT